MDQKREVFEINKMTFPIIAEIEPVPGVFVPLLSIPMMTDEKWRSLTAEKGTGCSGAATGICPEQTA